MFGGGCDLYTVFVELFRRFRKVCQINWTTAAVSKTWKLSQYSCRPKIISVLARMNAIQLDYHWIPLSPTSYVHSPTEFWHYVTGIASSTIIIVSIVHNIRFMCIKMAFHIRVSPPSPIQTLRRRSTCKHMTRRLLLLLLVLLLLLFSLCVAYIFFAQLSSASCYLSMQCYFRCIKSKVETWISSHV